MKYTTVILAKCVVVAETAKDFHNSVVEALQAMEEAAQSYGWGQAVIEPDTFDCPPPPYGPGNVMATDLVGACCEESLFILPKAYALPVKEYTQCCKHLGSTWFCFRWCHHMDLFKETS